MHGIHWTLELDHYKGSSYHLGCRPLAKYLPNKINICLHNKWAFYIFAKSLQVHLVKPKLPVYQVVQLSLSPEFKFGTSEFPWWQYSRESCYFESISCNNLQYFTEKSCK